MRYALATTLILGLSTAQAAERSLSHVDKLPKGLSPAIAQKLDASGAKVNGAGGAYCTIWLAKELAVKPEFNPTLNITYPLTPGQLVGALQVGEKAAFTDFRGQELEPGVYTLRYGQQPVDGNHIGTSQLYDFLLALPAAADTKPAPITSFDELSGASAKAAGSNHPAIFSLLPAKEAQKKAQLEHDENKDFWILQLTGQGKAGDKSVKVPIRVVVVGETQF